MDTLPQRVDALDISLFDAVPAQLGMWDKRALLGLHAAVASTWGNFNYLEIGSYLGGSLQVLIRDPRCAQIISIDPRLQEVPDARAPWWTYADNSTEHMLRNLGEVPDADLAKLLTIETRSVDVSLDDLPVRPAFCFIDGEHTDHAALRDAELCLAAIGGQGVIAFHDYMLIQSGIRAFLRTHWSNVSSAMLLGTSVFAIETGNRGALRNPMIYRSSGSQWHNAVWRSINRWSRWPHAALAAVTAIPVLDVQIANWRRRLHLDGRA